MNNTIDNQIVVYENGEIELKVSVENETTEDFLVVRQEGKREVER